MQTLGMGLKVAMVCHLTGVQTTVPYSEAFEPYPCEATGRVATMARLHVKVRNGTQMFGRGSIERKCVRLWCRIHERTATRSMPASVAQLPTLLKCALQATLEVRRWLRWLCRWGFVPAQTLRFSTDTSASQSTKLSGRHGLSWATNRLPCVHGLNAGYVEYAVG